MPLPLSRAKLYPRHEIHTFVSMQWGGIETVRCTNRSNATLLRCFLPAKKYGNQEQLEGCPFTVLVIPRLTGPWSDRMFPIIDVAIDPARPGQLLAACSLHENTQASEPVSRRFGHIHGTAPNVELMSVKSQRLSGRLKYGHARVSTDDQNPALQLEGSYDQPVCPVPFAWRKWDSATRTSARVASRSIRHRTQSTGRATWQMTS
jgi:hypothetical protein